jgi:hypothetical protein
MKKIESNSTLLKFFDHKLKEYDYSGAQDPFFSPSYYDPENCVEDFYSRALSNLSGSLAQEQRLMGILQVTMAGKTRLIKEIAVILSTKN